MALSFRRIAAANLRSNASASSSRWFGTSSPALARRTRSKMEEDFTIDEIEAMTIDETSEIQDSPSAGHIRLRDQRQTLHYMRLIEHEMPKLVAFRKPFMPPPATEFPLVVRSTNYGGEEHPVMKKRVVVAHVDSLPLKDKDAIHKLQLLAGPRWTPHPPADSGIAKSTPWGAGFVKISCEDFPTPEMNLQWANDTLNRLIAESNSKDADYLLKMPLDLRHVYAKVRKAKKGDHLRDRIHNKPSLESFPKEWLPSTA